MTRKKYIKKLMALGMSRNGARECAAAAIADGLTYQDAYDRAVGMSLAMVLKKVIRASDIENVLIFDMFGRGPFMPASMCRDIVAACAAKPYTPVIKKHGGLRAHVHIIDELHAHPTDPLVLTGIEIERSIQQAVQNGVQIAVEEGAPLHKITGKHPDLLEATT